MEPTTRTNPVHPLIFKILGVLEILGLAAAIVGISLKHLQLPGADETLMIGMSVLSMAYFLMAYKPPANTKSGAERRGFASLIVGTVLPRVAWIACSVSIIGMLFAILHLHGSGEMLMVGVSVLGVYTILAIYFIATGSEETPLLMSILYRAAPILVVGLYMFMNLPPK